MRLTLAMDEHALPEWSLAALMPLAGMSFQLSATYAKHEYDFTRSATGREQIVDGNDLDSAPRWIAHAAWRMAISDTLNQELEVNRVGSYFVNAANTARYKGHYAVNWRMQWQADRVHSA